jgi:PAS domain S-box-containing protein
MNTGTGTKSSHILILEDDVAHQDLALRAFREDPETFRVSIAVNIREARQVIERDLPDLIIADWLLPDGKGIEILPRIEGRVTIPLVIMTSHGDEHLAVEIMKSGAIDYVVKSATTFRDLPHIARHALNDWENIRQRQRAEQERRETEKRLADIIGFLPDAVLAVNTDGRVIAWNKAMEEITGVPAGDMLGKADHEYSLPLYGDRRPILIDLVLKDDVETEKKYLSFRREGEKLVSEAFVPAAFGGRGAYVWVAASPLYDTTGKTVGAIETIRDITDRKQMDEVLILSNEILRASYAGLALNPTLNKVVALVQRYTGCDSVAIRLLDETGHIPYRVYTGFTREFYELESPLSIHEDKCMCINVITGTTDPKLPFYTQDGSFYMNGTTRFLATVSEVDKGSTRNVCNQAGYESVALVPLRERGRITGLIHIADHREGMVPLRVVRVLENIAPVVGEVVQRLLMEESLKATREWLGIALKAAHAGTWDWDIPAGRLTWSPEFFGLFGLPSGATPTFETWRAVLHPDDRGPAQAKIDRALKDHASSLWNEYRIILPGGDVRWIGSSSSTLYTDAGDPVRMSGASLDITVRKQAEESLRSQNATLETLLNAPLYILTLVDRQGTIIRMNRDGANRIGARVHDVTGKNVYSILPPDLAASRKPFIDRVFETGEPAWFDDERSGTYLHNEIYPVFNQDHTGVEQIVIFATDITERKRAEEKLRESEEKFREIFNNVSDAVHIHEVDEHGFPGRFIEVNDAACRMLQYTREELLAKDLSDFDIDYRSLDLGTIGKNLKTAGHMTFETRHSRKDGTIIDVEISVHYTVILGKEVFVSMVRDITERKYAEIELEESERKFRTVADYTYDWEFWLGPDAKFKYISPSCERISGYKPDDFLQDPNLMEKIVHPEEFGLIHDHAESVQTNTGTEDFIEFRIITRDGRTVWIGHDCRPIYTSDGTYLGRRGSNRDITERKLAEEALRESEMKYRELVDHVPIGVGIVTFDGHPLAFNDALCRITGISPDTIRETNTLDNYANPEDRTRLFERLTQERVIRDYEVSMKQPDGTPYYANLNLVRFLFKGEPVALIMMEDISEKKKAEEALRQSETRFRALIHNSSDIIRILDREGRIVYESPSAERLLGYPPGSQIGRDPMDYIHPDDRDIVKKDLQAVYDRANTGIPTEFRIRTAGGEYIWVDALGVNLLDVPGVNGVVITTRPIQQRKQAEQEISESEGRLRLALEGADAAFWDWDLPSGKEFFSDRFYTMLGYTPGEFPATYDAWVALMHPDDRDHVLPDLRQQIQEKRPLCEIEYRLLSKERNWIWILGRGKIVAMDEQGNPARLTGVNIDITNRRLMESEIRSLNTVLEQRVKDRTEALSKANEALEEENAQRVEAESRLKAAYDEKVMLIKEIHHRVKNNLQIIISLLNLQSRYITDEATLAAIKESQNRVRAMSLVHEKLYQADNVSKIQIKDYIRFLGNGLFQFYGAKSRGVRLTLDVGNVDATINTAIPLGLIINELISNSLKYAFPDGRTGEITITVRKEDQALHIQFRDNGAGIPETLDWKNTKSLGLRLVNTLVDQLNGTVELDRSAGTQFTMVLHEKE